MPLFRRNAKEPLPADSTNKLEGYAAGNVTIHRLPIDRRVEILLIDCATGETVFKCHYKTQLKSDFAAYEDAKVRVNDYLVSEGLVLQDELTTNAALPSITTHRRGNRW